MIKTLQLHNFKAFQDTGKIEIKPITVLAGPNSGGKSSILQSLLLLKQTLEGGSPDVALDLDGRFLQFSRFEELVFGKPAPQHCEVSYRIGFEEDVTAEDIRYLRYENTYPYPLFKDTESLPLRSDMEFSFRQREVTEGRSRVVLDRFGVFSQVQNRSLPHATIIFHGGKYRMEIGDIESSELHTGQVTTRYFLPALPELLAVGEKEYVSESEYRVHFILLNPILLYLFKRLEEEFRKYLKYIGPLREEPHRVYVSSGNPSSEIGQKGENAAQILWLERDDKVQYLRSLYQEPEELTLQNAVGDAFRSLGIEHPIGVKFEEQIVYQILFGLIGSEGKKQVTIADVGFGVSQLLPVVLMGVRSEESSLLLFEQPEIHLHPKLQANLADFFLRMALLGKRIIVETHSDHFINRLRRRIAEDEADELKDKISILFVHPPHDGQGATIKPLKVDRYGIIENWPPDFLPESADEAEAILMAGLEKRKGE